jgi:hypothetical protein
MARPDPLALALACVEAFANVSADVLAAPARGPEDALQLAARARVGASLALVALAEDVRRLADLVASDYGGGHQSTLEGM